MNPHPIVECVNVPGIWAAAAAVGLGTFIAIIGSAGVLWTLNRGD